MPRAYTLADCLLSANLFCGKSLLTAVALLLFLTGNASAQNAEYAFRDAKGFADSVQRNQNKRQLRHYWFRAIEKLQAVADKYPRSPKAPEAQFLVGKLYLDMADISLISDDVDSAVEAYRTMVKNYPSHRLADDAQYYIGVIYRDRRRDRTGAYVEFERVTTFYPKGDMAPAARKELASLADSKPAATLAKTTLVNVSRILHWSNKDYTRIAIYLGEKAEFKFGLLPEDNKAQKPRRLYVDIINARLDPSLRNAIPIQDGLLQQARAGQFNNETVRVVLDMNSVGDYKVIPLFSPFRIIIDVYGAEVPAPPDDTTSVASIVATEPLPPAPSVEQAAPQLKAPPVVAKAKPAVREEASFRPGKDAGKVPFAYQFGLNIRRIVIDAGHGGHDPGAIGIKKLKEKEVTLAIAKKLAVRLRKRLKLETVLTRDDDSFIQLEGRPGIAKARRGDLFISIHANSAPTKNAYGIETYHLDFTSDRSAILVAARENSSSEKGVSEQESILRDLMLTSKKNDSIQLARAVQTSMIGGLSKDYKDIKSLGVKGAPFVVLIGANIPAILVEVGFVSNPREAGRLKDSKYTDRLADAVVTGVEQYIKNLKATTF